MHVEIWIDFEQYSSSARNQGHDKRDEIWMSLITCGSIFIKVMNGLVRKTRDFCVISCSIM